jgi:hypothetical protein
MKWRIQTVGPDGQSVEFTVEGAASEAASEIAEESGILCQSIIEGREACSRLIHPDSQSCDPSLISHVATSPGRFECVPCRELVCLLPNKFGIC